MKLTIYIALLSFSLLSCSKEPKLEGFNSEVWKKDKKGCEGKRSILAETLFSQRSELKGIDFDDLISILGKPEKTNAEDRGKKSYAYYIEPGSQCGTELLLEGTKIVFEVDALGYVSMVIEERY